MQVGDTVIIHPAHSVRFGGRHGVIVASERDIVDCALSLTVQFNNGTRFYFAPYEVLTEAEFLRGNTPAKCGRCGVDITGQFTYLCEDCAYPVPEGGL